jgi:hypothetical protein
MIVPALLLLFCGLATPFTLRAMFRMGEFWAFLLSTLLFALLCFLAMVRQRQLACHKVAAGPFTSLLDLIWRRKLTAVFASGFLLMGSILHGVLIGMGF